MESSSNANSLLDPNFALNLYCKYGKIEEIVPKMKLIIEEFRKNDGSDKAITHRSNSKNNQKSKELSEEAAKQLSCNKDQSTLLEALKLYNESLCHAEGDIGHLYACRAKIYFDLMEYQICLENISLAEDNGYDESDSNQWKKLKADSLERIQKRLNDQNVTEGNARIQQDVKPYQQIPHVLTCLELKCDTVQGRHIVTTEDIHPGTILIAESPFVKVLNSDCIYRRCSNCLARNSMNLIPCPNCSKAMFCTASCMEEALKSFHRFECPIIDCLINVSGEITFRTFLKAIKSFNSILELIEFLHTADTTNNAITFPSNHSEKLTQQEDYHRIHCLSTNQNIRSALDLFTHTMVAALFYYQLSHHCPPFMDLIRANECSDSEDSLMELMFRIELISTINNFNFDDLSSEQEGAIFGTGLYGFSSLINHSCNPNAWPKFHKNGLILYTTQPIQRGDVISISYTAFHAFQSKQERQSFLIGKYHFLCQCIACTKDFPLLCDMTLANIPEIHSNGIQLDKAIAENIYRKCCVHLRECYQHYPCREKFAVQMCLSKLLSYLLMNDGTFQFESEK